MRVLCAVSSAVIAVFAITLQGCGTGGDDSSTTTTTMAASTRTTTTTTTTTMTTAPATPSPTSMGTPSPSNIPTSGPSSEAATWSCNLAQKFDCNGAESSAIDFAGANTPNDCRQACASNGQSGCCEFQTDHQRCMLIPSSTIRSGDEHRYAGLCSKACESFTEADYCPTSRCTDNNGRCKARATCATTPFDCSGEATTTANTGGSVYCSGNATTCDASICCEATCGSYTCITTGWVKKSGVGSQLNPDESKCCQQPCDDIVPVGQSKWADSDGDDCAAYVHYKTCSTFGHSDKYSAFGYTANQACCGCGGGQAPTPAPTPLPPGATHSPTSTPTSTPTVSENLEGQCDNGCQTAACNGCMPGCRVKRMMFINGALMCACQGCPQTPPSSIVVITDAPVSRLRSAIAAKASVLIGLSVVTFFAAGVAFFAAYTHRPRVNTMVAREIELA